MYLLCTIYCFYISSCIFIHTYFLVVGPDLWTFWMTFPAKILQVFGVILFQETLPCNHTKGNPFVSMFRSFIDPFEKYARSSNWIIFNPKDRGEHSKKFLRQATNWFAISPWGARDLCVMCLIPGNMNPHEPPFLSKGLATKFSWKVGRDPLLEQCHMHIITRHSPLIPWFHVGQPDLKLHQANPHRAKRPEVFSGGSVRWKGNSPSISRSLPSSGRETHPKNKGSSFILGGAKKKHTYFLWMK